MHGLSLVDLLTYLTDLGRVMPRICVSKLCECSLMGDGGVSKVLEGRLAFSDGSGGPLGHLAQGLVEWILGGCSWNACRHRKTEEGQKGATYILARRI